MAPPEMPTNTGDPDYNAKMVAYYTYLSTQPIQSVAPEAKKSVANTFEPSSEAAAITVSDQPPAPAILAPPRPPAQPPRPPAQPTPAPAQPTPAQPDFMPLKQDPPPAHSELRPEEVRKKPNTSAVASSSDTVQRDPSYTPERTGFFNPSVGASDTVQPATSTQKSDSESMFIFICCAHNLINLLCADGQGSDEVEEVLESTPEKKEPSKRHPPPSEATSVGESIFIFICCAHIF